MAKFCINDTLGNVESKFLKKNEKHFIHHCSYPNNHLGDFFFSLSRYRRLNTYSISHRCNFYYTGGDTQGIKFQELHLKFRFSIVARHINLLYYTHVFN